jgi:hypothetical protein
MSTSPRNTTPPQSHPATCVRCRVDFLSTADQLDHVHLESPSTAPRPAGARTGRR